MYSKTENRNYMFEIDMSCEGKHFNVNELHASRRVKVRVKCKDCTVKPIVGSGRTFG